jgi:hypothetical protein
MAREWVWGMIVAAGCLAAGCGGSEPAATPESSAAAPAGPASAPAPAAPAGPFNVASVFPEGAGRDQVLNTCGSCHPVACTAIGQRTPDRWDAIRAGHAEHLSSASDADVEAMFAYLKEHFSDTKPEPRIPPEFVQQGCTPF